MGYEVTITPQAEENLTAITDYITHSLQAPLTAEKVKAKILKGLNKLSYLATGSLHLRVMFPEIHFPYDFQLYHPYKKYLALFVVRENENVVYVTNLLSKGQDFKRLFQ